MRVLLLVGLLSACKYHAPGDDDGTITIVEDTAADFADATLDGGEIDPVGAITPAPYSLFGLHAVAYAGKHVDAGYTFAMFDAEVLALTPSGESYAQLPIDWGNTHPRSLALGATRNEDWSVAFDGEIHLQAGTTTISIDADDAGMLEVTVDGTPFFVADASPGAQSVDVITPADGWYPIRAAIGESTGNAKLLVTVGGAPLGARILRSRIHSTGLLAQVYDAGHTTLDGTIVVPSADQALGSVVPPPSYDIPIGSTHTFQARYAGQIHIDQPGSWIFETTSADQDSTRLWIDRVHVASKFGTNAFGLFDGVPPTATVELTAGWHHIAIDMLVEQSDGMGGPAHPISLRLLATPPGGISASVDGAQLRPVVSSAVAIGVVDETDHPLVVDGETKFTITLPATDLHVRSIDAGAFMFHTDANAYTVTLEAGAAVIPMTDGATLAAVYDDDTFVDQIPQTAWMLHFVDTQAGGTFGDPKTLFAFVDVTGDGSAALPFAREVTYVSKPLPTPDATALGAIRTRSTLDGAQLALAVRTADSEDELAAAEFVDVADGDIPDVAAGQLAQYRVSITGDGWQFPVIDAIELDYIAP